MTETIDDKIKKKDLYFTEKCPDRFLEYGGHWCRNEIPCNYKNYDASITDKHYGEINFYCKYFTINKSTDI